MEKLEFSIPARAATPGQNFARGFALCGVVGSGNLEVLVDAGPAAGFCEVSVSTSARGFGQIWQALLSEFAAQNPAGGTRIAINDMGATPAVVSLRLGQALSEYLGAER
jgi:malonate decarboxylase delta subunit